MSKKILCAMFVIVACISMSIPVFALGDEEKCKYRIYLQAMTSESRFDINAYREQKIVKAGWGIHLSFTLAAWDNEADITGTELADYLRDGERVVTGAYWEAVLPDGTIVSPQGIYEEVEPSHWFDENPEEWLQECIVFRFPFEMTGKMIIRAAIDGKVVAEYEVFVSDTDCDGNPIRGWVWSCQEPYYIQDDGALARGWKLIDGKWFYFDEKGIAQTGWQYVSYNGEYNWYYFDVKGIIGALGKMNRGWQKIGNTWYYFHKDGSMASNEWVGGYWLSANGAWKYQPKGRWRKNSKGWWFEDERGWYPKNEKVTINGVEYTFATDGYLVE